MQAPYRTNTELRACDQGIGTAAENAIPSAWALALQLFGVLHVDLLTDSLSNYSTRWSPPGETPRSREKLSR